MRRHLLYARSPRWAELAPRLEELMASAAFSVHKAEGRVRAGLLDVGDGRRVFVKRVESRTPLRGLIERVRGSRARRALKGAAMLEAAAIPHPAPLVALELRSIAGAVRASYLVSEPLENARTLSIFALGRRGERRGELRRRIAITRAVAAAVRQVHERGLYTRDLQETNLMLEATDDGFRIYFIDLEDFARARRVPERRRLLNLVHLDRSIGRFVGRAGRLRFLYAYLGQRPERAEIRRTVGQLLRLRARLDRRAAQAGRRERSMPAAVSAA
jgi:tRNA A-37 threonylcarbamoyl transferase component Bud32